MNDANGYEYPVDNYGQIHVPLEIEQSFASLDEEENINKTKN